MKEGGFNLRKWKSSSKELSERINECERVNEVSTEAGEGSSPTENVRVSEDNQTYVKSTIGPQLPDDSKAKILGVNWNVETDDLYYEFSEIQRYARMLPPTKRTVLKLVAKIFDPLGLLSAFTIKLKMMFQSLCKDKTDWDEELRGVMRVLYDALVNELTQLSGVSVPRCYFSRSSKAREHQLHGFSDASEKAYAAVKYLRTKYDNEHVDVNLVASKTRVAPIKQQTIPRLELLGATILARLVESISSSLMPTLGKLEKFNWVDSSAVLCWVKNNKLWKQFVQHRIQEIRRSSSKNAWWKGPEFLQRPEEEWPNDLACENTDPIAMAEVTKHKTDIVHSLANQAKPLNSDISTVIDCARFSTKTRLLRTTAYVLRFVKVLRKEKTRREEVTETENAETGERGRSFELSTLELRQAEELWIKAVQKNSFEEELKFLSSNKVSIPPTYVAQFGLYVDEQSLIRCAGRIKNAHLPNSSKCPVLLPKNHHFTNLVIQEVHHRMKHVGINQTLSSLREQFWVIRGREIVKKNVRRCVVCKRNEGRPYKPQVQPDLPSFRVDDAPPFAHTGLDFLGPLYVSKTDDAPDAISSKKTYVCLYTCASTRAIHLEITPDLTVPSFLRSFRRFVSRFGLPATLISDNAKTFKSASREVKNIIRSVEVQRHLTDQGVNWQFIIERAPWWGGFWEGMVRTVKRVLKRVIIGRSNLNYDELYIIFTEVESIVNDRPITYVYDDVE